MQYTLLVTNWYRCIPTFNHQNFQVSSSIDICSQLSGCSVKSEQLFVTCVTYSVHDIWAEVTDLKHSHSRQFLQLAPAAASQLDHQNMPVQSDEGPHWNRKYFPLYFWQCSQAASAQKQFCLAFQNMWTVIRIVNLKDFCFVALCCCSLQRISQKSRPTLALGKRNCVYVSVFFIF